VCPSLGELAGTHDDSYGSFRSRAAASLGVKPSRRPLPEHLPRERVVYPMPQACPCCGGALHKLGEDERKFDAGKLESELRKRLRASPASAGGAGL